MTNHQTGLPSPPQGRAGPRLAITLALLLGNYIWVPMATCGCHLHAIALAPLIPAVPWGVYALLTHRGGFERWVGWFAFLNAIFCLWLQFEANFKFYLMST